MATLLVINSSPRGNRSVSRQLTSAFASTWLQHHPDGRVLHRDLRDTPTPHLDDSWINAAKLPSSERTDAQRRLLAHSDELIAELQAADHFVFGVPMYNYTVPSTLKSYIDHVIRSGVTVRYAEGGLVTLLKAKAATAITASSGSFREGSPLETWNFLAPYLKKVLGLLAFDVEVITVEGLADAAQREVIVANAQEQIRTRISLAAGAKAPCSFTQEIVL